MERNDNEDMKIVHDSRPGIRGRAFRIKFEKDAFRSDFIIGPQLPAASTAIYTPRFIKTIKDLATLELPNYFDSNNNKVSQIKYINLGKQKNKGI